MSGMMEGLQTMLESVEVVVLTAAAVIQLPLILITGLRLRSWIGFWVVTLMVTTTVQFLLWPIPHSLLVDDVTHVQGLGFFSLQHGSMGHASVLCRVSRGSQRQLGSAPESIYRHYRRIGSGSTSHLVVHVSLSAWS